jgi:hypothetical protein
MPPRCVRDRRQPNAGEIDCSSRKARATSVPGSSDAHFSATDASMTILTSCLGLGNELSRVGSEIAKVASPAAIN